MPQSLKLKVPPGLARTAWRLYLDSERMGWLLAEMDGRKLDRCHLGWITFGGVRLHNAEPLPLGYFVGVQILEATNRPPRLGGLFVDWNPHHDSIAKSARSGLRERPAFTVEQNRRLPLAAMVKYGANELRRLRDGGEWWDELPPLVDSGKPPKGSVNEASFLSAVEVVFSAARAGGVSGQAAVANHFNVSLSQAARYVARAREVGIIEPSPRTAKGRAKNG